MFLRTRAGNGILTRIRELTPRDLRAAQDVIHGFVFGRGRRLIVETSSRVEVSQDFHRGSDTTNMPLIRATMPAAAMIP